MDPLMGGMLSLGGGIIQQLFGRQNQKDAQAFSAQQAANQMSFQERMSSSAWQRGMQDMKAGGLNPILAYQKGPASSPTGAMASTTPQVAHDVVTPAISTARQGQRVNAEVDNMVQTNKNLRAQEMQTQAQTLTQGAQLANINAHTKLLMEQLSEAQKKASLAQYDKDFYDSWPGWIARMLGNVAGEAGRVVGGANAPITRVNVNPRPGYYGQ